MNLFLMDCLLVYFFFVCLIYFMEQKSKIIPNCDFFLGRVCEKVSLRGNRLLCFVFFSLLRHHSRGELDISSPHLLPRDPRKTS